MVIINGVETGNNLILDSGFQFGRGVFETILVKDTPIFLNEHCARLAKATSFLNINNNVDEKYIMELIRKYKIENCVLKIIISDKNIVLTTRPSKYTREDYSRGFKIKISSLIKNETSHLTYVKSLNYTDNIIEKENAAKEGYDEVIFLNTKTEVAEGSISNIFFIKDNKIFTPKVECGLLNGIIRQWVIYNFEVSEGRYHVDDLKMADEVFLTNSIMGIMKVNTINEAVYIREDILNIIRNKYEINMK